jgi:cellulase
MRSSAILVAAAAAIPAVSAHGYVDGLKNMGAFFQGANPNWYYQPAGTAPVTAGWRAMNQDNGFVSPDSFGTSDIACHKSATAGGAYATVAAGSAVQLFWNTWPDTHKGPVINYIAPCNGKTIS